MNAPGHSRDSKNNNNNKKKKEKKSKRNEGKLRNSQNSALILSTSQLRQNTLLSGTQELKLNSEREWEKKRLTLAPASTHAGHTPISEKAPSPRLKGQAPPSAQ